MNIQRYYQTIDLHTAGEPLRIITGGIPPIPGETMMEKRKYFSENMDDVRQILMREPRGHSGMYGSILTPPVNKDADIGVLFMHNEGLSTMCGHGIIAIMTAAYETGMLPSKAFEKDVIIDSPAGKVYSRVNSSGLTAKSVTFDNVASFVLESNLNIKMKGFEEVKVDVAFGGAFYAIVNVDDLRIQATIKYLPILKKVSTMLKNEIERKINVKHPLSEKLKGIYGVIFSSEPSNATSHLKNVTVFADEQIDRSPCGTGTSARIAALYHHGKLKIGEDFVHEGIVGSKMTGKIIETSMVGDYQAILPEITGSASITGFHQFVVDPSDPFKNGFLLK